MFRKDEGRRLKEEGRDRERLARTGQIVLQGGRERERSEHPERERSEPTPRERSEPTERERSEPTPRERSEPQNPPCVSATNLIPDRPVHPEPECLLRKWIDRYVHVAGQQARPGQGILVREKDRSLPKTGLHVHS